MSFFREESDEPIPRDWEGLPLTESQLHQIEYYLNRIEKGVFSHDYLSELRHVAGRTFQQAHSRGDKEKMSDVGPELQVIDHVLRVAFDGKRPKKNLALDPKHEQFLSYLNNKALEAVMAEEEIDETEDEADELEDEIEVEEEMEAVEESVVPLVVPGLAADVVAAFYPRSPHPAIAKIQEKLERLVYDYRDAVEDGEPAFILNPILRKIQRAHEELEAQF